MLLAGGQGSRLYALTNNIAKPAVPFGAKYRIIDFPLSNCVNSGIDTVGVLTQYQPLVLNEYIGNGQPWDLDRNFGGVHVLSPYQKKSKSAWYEGTANAIYQNLNFIKMYNPSYVLILSGDHIYKMDYSKMLRAHIENDADCTIAAIQVPLKEASRFGILNTNPDGSVYEFEEKPKQPKSTLASMGERMFAYQFEGYWKDVGTISSLWEANMDLLGEDPAFDVADNAWKIHSRNPLAPPAYLGDHSVVKNSMIALGSEVYGTVENSVLSSNVVIEEGAVVRDSVIMSNTVVHKGAVINYSIIDESVAIESGAKIGEEKESAKGIAVLGRGITVGKDAKVAAGNIVDKSIKEGEEA